MKRIIFRSCMVLALAVAGMSAVASAQERPRLNGVWDVNVTIKNCDTGQVLRNIHALNLFIHGGSMTETGASLTPALSRSSSVGTWHHVHDDIYASTFKFFRFNSDGSLFSSVKVTRMIQLSQDGRQFISAGTTEDFFSDGTTSVTCPIETATRAQ